MKQRKTCHLERSWAGREQPGAKSTGGLRGAGSCFQEGFLLVGPGYLAMS